MDGTEVKCKNRKPVKVYRKPSRQVEKKKAKLILFMC